MFFEGSQQCRVGLAQRYAEVGQRHQQGDENARQPCPAGFLPLTAGSVRKDKLADIYRHSPLFEQLHDPSQFEGHCGVCEFRALCGGSRARAFGATGDPLTVSARTARDSAAASARAAARARRRSNSIAA